MTAEAPAPAGTAGTGWTGRARRGLVGTLPPEELLPDTQPAYVASWIYVFGVATTPGRCCSWPTARTWRTPRSASTWPASSGG